MAELRNKFRLVPMSLRVRELREAGAVVRWVTRELERLPVAAADNPALVTAAYTMARLAEGPEYELHEGALAELREIMDSLWMTDDELIEKAIRDLIEFCYDDDRLDDLRALGLDEELLADMRAESAELLAELLRDEDDPHLAVVKTERSRDK